MATSAHNVPLAVDRAPTACLGDAPRGGAVPCVYCRTPIPGSAFDFWSDGKRLLSGDCPTCTRRSTYTTNTWLRWLTQMPDEPAGVLAASLQGSGFGETLMPQRGAGAPDAG